MSDIQPTPETDDFIIYAVRTDHNWRTFARKLERERDSAKTLSRSLLDQLEAQAVQIEALRRERDEALALAKNYSERWTAECKTLRGKNEAMREAIKEAHDALMLAPYRDQEALAKLQPFLKP